jgi:hypothetical protein
MTPSLTVHGVLPGLAVPWPSPSPRPCRRGRPPLGMSPSCSGAPSCRHAGSQPRWSLVLPYLRDVLPRGFPIEAWEVEDFWLDGPDNQQARAAEVTKAVVTLLAGGAHRVIWLPPAYNPSALNSEIRWGLLNPGWKHPSGRRGGSATREGGKRSFLAPGRRRCDRGSCPGRKPSDHSDSLERPRRSATQFAKWQTPGRLRWTAAPSAAGGWRSAWSRACLHHRAERTRLGPTPATSAVTVSSPCRPIGSTWTFEGSTSGNPDKELREERYKDPLPRFLAWWGVHSES